MEIERFRTVSVDVHCQGAVAHVERLGKLVEEGYKRRTISLVRVVGKLSVQIKAVEV